MKRPVDLLFLVIVLGVGLVGTLAPFGGASFASSVAGKTGFSESLLLGASGAPPRLSPALFEAFALRGRVVVGRYEVSPTDTLASVSKTFGSAPDFLRSTNQLNSTRLVPGKILAVHNGLGMLYRVREKNARGETLQEIAKKYHLSAGTLARANALPGVALLSESGLDPGRILFLPTVRLRFTDYLMPVDWTRGQRMISSGFGYRRHPILKVRLFHQGLDLPRPAGAPVRAVREGVVTFVGWRGALGQLIVLRHDDGLSTWYGHLSSTQVVAGQRVARGSLIGRVGSSGLATGPHLHFEVRDRFGNALNPKKFLF